MVVSQANMSPPARKTKTEWKGADVDFFNYHKEECFNLSNLVKNNIL